MFSAYDSSQFHVTVVGCYTKIVLVLQSLARTPKVKVSGAQDLESIEALQMESLQPQRKIEKSQSEAEKAWSKVEFGNLNHLVELKAKKIIYMDSLLFKGHSFVTKDKNILQQEFWKLIKQKESSLHQKSQAKGSAQATIIIVIFIL